MRPCLLCLLILAALPVHGAVHSSSSNGDKRLGEIQITGLTNATLARVRAALESHTLQCERPYWEVTTEIRRSARIIRNELRIEGYYSPGLESDVRRTGGCWQATIAVTPGTRATLRRVDIEVSGDESSRFLEIIQRFHLKPGAAFLESEYVALKQALGSAALENGFFESHFAASVVDVYADEGKVDVRLVFVPGAQYRFGEVRLHADEMRITERIFRKKIQIRPGDAYSAEALNTLRRDLLSTGYLKNARTDLDQHAQTHVVDVDVMLEFVAHHEFSAGVGYATDVGPRLRLSYDNRFVNHAGHQLSHTLTISPNVREITQSYRMPLNARREQWLDITGGYGREITNTTETRTISAGVRRLVTFRPGRLRVDSLDFTHDDFEIGEQRGSPIFVTPGVRWVFGELQGSRLQWGHTASLNVRAASERLLSDANLVQGEFRAYWSRLLGEKSRIALRWHAGMTLARSFSSTPPSLRFFAGGDTSVRGYGNRTIGPRDVSGEVIGGRNLVVSSAEFERLFKPRWSWAAFFDAGDAFNDAEIDVKKGVGLGIRWHSPAGAIRLDVAHPLDDPHREFRLHVGIGATF